MHNCSSGTEALPLLPLKEMGLGHSARRARQFLCFCYSIFIRSTTDSVKARLSRTLETAVGIPDYSFLLRVKGRVGWEAGSLARVDWLLLGRFG